MLRQISQWDVVAHAKLNRAEEIRVTQVEDYLRALNGVIELYVYPGEIPQAVLTLANLLNNVGGLQRCLVVTHRDTGIPWAVLVYRNGVFPNNILYATDKIASWMRSVSYESATALAEAAYHELQGSAVLILPDDDESTFPELYFEVAADVFTEE